MDKEFVSYEQALALKELGFDEPCLTYYFSDGVFNDTAEEDDTLHPGDPRFHSDTNSLLAEYLENELKYKAVAAPTFSQAFRWFRNKYNMCGWVQESYFKGLKFHQYHISRVQTLNIISDLSKCTYEEAEIACLNELIETAIKQKQ